MAGGCTQRCSGSAVHRWCVGGRCDHAAAATHGQSGQLLCGWRAAHCTPPGSTHAGWACGDASGASPAGRVLQPGAGARQCRAPCARPRGSGSEGGRAQLQVWERAGEAGDGLWQEWPHVFGQSKPSSRGTSLESPHHRPALRTLQGHAGHPGPVPGGRGRPWRRLLWHRGGSRSWRAAAARPARVWPGSGQPGHPGHVRSGHAGAHTWLLEL